MNATHRPEYTGNAGLDRIQANVRDLIATLNVAITRILALEGARGVGVARVVMANTDYALSPAELAAHSVILTGAHTAARTLTLEQATDAKGYVRWISNLTTGGFAITVTSGSNTVSIANGVTKAVLVSGTGIGLQT